MCVNLSMPLCLLADDWLPDSLMTALVPVIGTSKRRSLCETKCLHCDCVYMCLVRNKLKLTSPGLVRDTAFLHKTEYETYV